MLTTEIKIAVYKAALGYLQSGRTRLSCLAIIYAAAGDKLLFELMKFDVERYEQAINQMVSEWRVYNGLTPTYEDGCAVAGPGWWSNTLPVAVAAKIEVLKKFIAQLEAENA